MPRKRPPLFLVADLVGWLVAGGVPALGLIGLAYVASRWLGDWMIYVASVFDTFWIAIIISLFAKETGGVYLSWAVVARVVDPNPRQIIPQLRNAAITPNYAQMNLQPALPKWHRFLVRKVKPTSKDIRRQIANQVKDMPEVHSLLQAGEPTPLGLPEWTLDLLPIVAEYVGYFDDGILWVRYLTLLSKGIVAGTTEDVIEASFEMAALHKDAAETGVILEADEPHVVGLIDAIESVRTASLRMDTGSRTSLLANAVGLCSRAASQAADPLLRQLADNWRTVINLELEAGQAPAQLVMTVLFNLVEAAEEANLVAILRNDGAGYAGKIRIRAPSPDYRVTPDAIEVLAPKAEERIYFRIPPAMAQPGEIRITFLIDYVENRVERTMEFVHTIQIKSPDTPPKPLELLNPYETGKPIRDGASPVFFGRDDVFQSISKRLDEDRRKQGGKSILLLVGERRLGKTSVLLQLDYQLGGEYIPVFCDAQGFNDSGDAAFLGWLSGHIRRKLKERDITVKPPTAADLAPAPTTVFGDFVYDQLVPALEGKCLLLLFDEFERMEDLIQEGKQSPGILLFLRGLMQHAAGISFIFAGTYRLLDMAAQYSSIMFNVAQTIRLEYLSRADLKRLVMEPVAGALSFESEAPNAIYDLTAGHPFLSQLLCFELVEQQTRRQKPFVSLSDVDNAARELVRKGQSHLEYLVSELAPLSLMLLSGHATWFEGRAVLASDLAGRLVSYRLDPRELELPKLLGRLAERGFLLSSKESSSQPLYRFRLQILRIWLVEHYPFEETLRTYAASKEPSRR